MQARVQVAVPRDADRHPGRAEDRGHDRRHVQAAGGEAAGGQADDRQHEDQHRGRDGVLQPLERVEREARAQHGAYGAALQLGGRLRSTSISPRKSTGSRVPCSRTHAAMRWMPSRRVSGWGGSKTSRTLLWSEKAWTTSLRAGLWTTSGSTSKAIAISST